MARSATAEIAGDVKTKACSQCKTVKPLEAFNRQAKGKYGRRSKCKVCYNAIDKAGREKRRWRNTKKCSRCEERKPLDCFSACQVTTDGFYAWCRACKRKVNQQRQWENGKWQPGHEVKIESIFAGYSDEQILLEVYKLRGKRKKIICPGDGPCTKNGEKTKARLTSVWWPYCELHRDTAQRVNLKKVRKELELA